MDAIIAMFCVAVAAISAFIIYLSFSSKPTFEEEKAIRRKIMKQIQAEKSSSDKIKDKKPKKDKKLNKDKKDQNDLIEPENDDHKLIKDNSNESVETKLNMVERLKKNKESVAFQSVEKKKQVPELLQENKSSNAPADKTNSIRENKKKKKDGKLSELNQESTSDITYVSDDIPELDQNALTSNASNNNSDALNATKKPSKKKRSDLNSINQLKNEKEAISVNLLISLIEKTEFSLSEVQSIIETLLNKQQDEHNEWFKGRQDPVVKLKKHLADAAQALKDEKEINIGLQAKLKELRSELTNDRVAARRTFEEQISTLQNDIKITLQKLNNVNEEKNALQINLQQLQKKINDEQMTLKLKEEQIQQQRMAEEKAHESIITLQAQVNQLTSQIQENCRIIDDYKHMQANLTRAYESSQFTLKDLNGKLKNFERSSSDNKAELDSQIMTNKNLFERNELLANQLKKQCHETDKLKEKYESLVSKMDVENWEKGFCNNKKQEIVQLEARLEEKDNQLKKLTTEVEFSKNQIQELSVVLSLNNTELTENLILLEKANSEIASLKEKINDNASVGVLQDDVINQLENSLMERNTELFVLKNEVESYKERNNELRNKNWKLVEELSKTEKALQNKVRNEQRSCEIKKSEVHQIHETITRLVKIFYPDIQVESNDNLENWLENVENAVMSRTNQSSNKQNLPELQAHNSHLQALVIHYKSIIIEAEKMLNQLETKVEIEEAKWKKKLKSLEETIAKLRSNHPSEVLLQP